MPPTVPIITPDSSHATSTVIFSMRCWIVAAVRTVSSYPAAVYCVRYGSKAALRHRRMPGPSSRLARLMLNSVELFGSDFIVRNMHVKKQQRDNDGEDAIA